MKLLKPNKAEFEVLKEYQVPESVFEDAVSMEFEPDELIVQNGQQLEYLYFVRSGKAKTSVSATNGKQLILTYVQSEGMIGDMELMTGKPNASTTIQAITPFYCVALPLKRCTNLLRADAPFLCEVGKELGLKLLRSSANSAVMALHPLEERLCAYIGQISVNHIFRERLTETSERIGGSYRQLLRCMDHLCKEGILRKQPDGYHILNQQELMKRAGDLYKL